MSDSRIGTREKYQRVQVFVRIRPPNNIEIRKKFKNVIETPPNGKEVMVHERQQDKVTKKFEYDGVFGPSTKQIDVYNAVVSPLLDQVLDGYNCTVFAYGQTGTGKTFTMEGINNDPTLHWQSDSSAGMIPRSLSHLFDKLQLIESQEYTVRVSFIELYNEELFDLLSDNDDGSKLRLYGNDSKKGAMVIHRLKEVALHNKSEVSKILERGSKRRHTAATLLNAQSSRSHTLFTFTVHMKENTTEGDEVLKTGKLNFVDLAGSEHVGQSGAINKRGRETGSINQSLLALGRVITALVERAPHIPYRESKLTRLLQGSLGGHTKTSIIATVSPASINLNDTLSTLDYAHRAKNVTNRPEINRKLTKTEFLNQSAKEIEGLQKDLVATRETISQQSKESEEKIKHIRALEESVHEREKILSELKLENIAQTEELNGVKLDTATDAPKSTSYRLKVTSQECDEQMYLVEKHVSTENVLLSRGDTRLNVADTRTTDSLKLHEEMDRETKAEETFKVLGEQFKRNLRECKQGIEKEISLHGEALQQFCESIKNDIGALLSQREPTNLINIGIDEHMQRLQQASIQMTETLQCACNRHLEACDPTKTEVHDRSTHASGAISKIRNNLKEHTDNDVKKVEAPVTVGTEKNEKLSTRTEREGKILLGELDSPKNTSYNALRQYQDLIERNLLELQQSMKVAKNKQLSGINDMRDAIANVSEEQVPVVTDQETNTSDTFEKISSELENRIAESIAWGNKVLEELDATVSEIDKFIDEDVEREFTVTSLDERILQRFREVKQLVETTEGEVDESQRTSF